MRRSGALAALILAVLAAQAAGQERGDITAFIGYQFGTSVDTRDGKLSAPGDINYGGILNFEVRPGAQLELSYNRQDTELKWEPFVGVPEVVPMSIEYLQIGGLGYIEQGITRPFASFTLGATHYNPDANQIAGRIIDNSWRFSMVLGLGVKAYPTERVGVRLQGHLAGTFVDNAGSLWCGVGTGCSVGFFGAGLLQGGFSGGLSIGF